MTRVRRCDLPDVTPGQLEAICKALADTMTGLTGTEIGAILGQCRIADIDRGSTKWKRLYNALGQRATKDGHPNSILNFGS